MNSSDSVGNVMQKDKDRAVKTMVNLAGILVYVAGIIYAEIHGYSLLSKGVDPQFLIWATIGIVALGITAIALPVGLHYSFHDSLQRYSAYAFYAVDLALLIFNAVLDFNLRESAGIPFWLTAYMTYILPATPIVAALGWSIISLLDPSQKERSTIETLRASTRETLRNRITQKALSVDIDKSVDAAAEQMALDVIEETLGQSVSRTRRRTPAKKDVIDAIPRQNGKVAEVSSFNQDAPTADFTHPR